MLDPGLTKGKKRFRIFLKRFVGLWCEANPIWRVKFMAMVKPMLLYVFHYFSDNLLCLYQYKRDIIDLSSKEHLTGIKEEVIFNTDTAIHKRIKAFDPQTGKATDENFDPKQVVSIHHVPSEALPQFKEPES